MKTLKKLSAIILAIVLLFGGIPMADIGLENLFGTNASAATNVVVRAGEKLYGDFVYKYIDDAGTVENSEIKIMKYMGNQKNVVVPDYIEGLPVTELAPYCFSYYTNNHHSNHDCFYIETVKLPDSIRTIGINAFEDCRYLHTINIPKDLLRLEENVFKSCKSLKELDFSNGIGGICADALNGTAITDLVISSKKRGLDFFSYALRGTVIENLTIITNSTYFEDYSLENDTLKTLNVNGTIEHNFDAISDKAFGDASIAHTPETINLYNDFHTDVFEVLEGVYGYSCEPSDEKEEWYTFTKSTEPREILTENGFQFYLDKRGNAVISKCVVPLESDTANTIIIPRRLGGATVTTIGYKSFANRKFITSVEIPDTVTHIQSSAFAKCNDLAEVKIGSGLKSIGYAAFDYCSNLKSINIPEGVKTLGTYTFYDCQNLTSLSAKGVTAVRDSAFEYSGIADVEFSPEFNSVGSYAFSSCDNLKYFKYDSNLTDIGEYAFKYSAIERFTFNDDLLEISEGVFENSKIREAVLPTNLVVIGDSAFHNCEYLTEINIPDTVTTIEEHAISFCPKLKGKLIIPDNVTKLGGAAFKETGYTSLFYNSPSLFAYEAFADSQISTIEFGDKVKSVSPLMFYGCNELKTVTLPETITKIGERAFKNCQNLESIIMSDSITDISEYAFENCKKLTELTLPKKLSEFNVNTFPVNLTTVYYNAENCTFEGLEQAAGTYYSPFYNTKITNVVIGDTVKRIPSYFFCKADFLEDVVLPDSVSEIGVEAFRYSSIKNITLPANLIIIENRAFYGTDVEIEGNTFPEGMRMIGQDAFAYCHEIRDVYIPDSVVDVAEGAFEACKKLSKVRMSPNVRLIATRAFYGCTVLTEFIWDSNIKLIADRAFYNCKALTSFDFTGVELLYPNSFTNTGVTLVTLGEDKNEDATNLIAIETQSFMDCEGLEAVSIGGNVTTIKSEAFASCSNLETAVISDSVINIAHDAFDDCNSLTIYCSEDSYAHTFAVRNDIPVSTFVVAPIPNQTYTGSEIEPEIDVSVSGERIFENTDFSVKYSNNVNVGTANVLVSGKGIFKVLSSIANFTIITKSITPVTFAEISEQDYTGEAVIPTITVTDGNRVLKEGVDYTVTYKNNVDEGTATATIQGIGNYHGTANVNFEIRELSVFERISNTISDFFTSIIAKIRSFFNSIFG